MSGLFLRLAAQASGQRDTSLRSPASLPYQGVQQRVEPLESAAQWPDLAMVHAAATEQPAVTPGHESAARLLDRQRHRLPSPPVPETQTAVAASGGSPPHDDASAAPLSRPERRDTQARSGLAVPPELMTQPIRTATVNPSAQQADASFVLNPRRPSEGDAPNPLAGSARNGSAVTEPVFGEHSAPLSLPAALLSPRPVAPSQAGAAAPLAAAQPLPSPQPDEVHIHIGRIEVTAIQERVPSTRASRKGAAPLSLDDYLAKRKGDSR